MENERKITQKGWFRNSILIILPTLISAIGVIISLNVSIAEKYSGLIIFVIAVTMLVLIGFVFFFSKQDETIYEAYQNVQKEKESLATILAHMENNIKTHKFTITAFSEMTEKFAKNIHSFANTVLVNQQVSDKNWDKTKYFDLICVQCKNMIREYGNSSDGTKISVGFIRCTENDGEKYVRMIAHSNPESTRPNACKKEERLLDSSYYYAELIKSGCSDIEVATCNEEIRRRFNNTSKTTDLSKYTQYIAIPVYCTSNKLLGIFQIVTKYDYYIEKDKVRLLKFAEESIIPFSNLIVLVDKIDKGLYLNPKKIVKEE